MAGLPPELMSRVGKGELTLSEAWDEHRSGTDGNENDLDNLGVGFDSPAFGRARADDDGEPGRYTGTVKYRPDGTVIESPAGEDTPDDPDTDPESEGEGGDGGAGGGGSGGEA